jgi:hypothetical protein
MLGEENVRLEAQVETLQYALELRDIHLDELQRQVNSVVFLVFELT